MGEKRTEKKVALVVVSTRTKAGPVVLPRHVVGADTSSVLTIRSHFFLRFGPFCAHTVQLFVALLVNDNHLPRESAVGVVDPASPATHREVVPLVPPPLIRQFRLEFGPRRHPCGLEVVLSVITPNVGANPGSPNVLPIYRETGHGPVARAPSQGGLDQAHHHAVADVPHLRSAQCWTDEAQLWIKTLKSILVSSELKLICSFK